MYLALFLFLGRCNKLNKKELIKEIAIRTKISQSNTRLIIDAFKDVVIDALSNNEKVVIDNFLKFEMKKQASRIGTYGLGENKGKNYITKERFVPKTKIAPNMKKEIIETYK